MERFVISLTSGLTIPKDEYVCDVGTLKPISNHLTGYLLAMAARTLGVANYVRCLKKA